MFHDIPQPILERMAYLEQQDAMDRRTGAPKTERLRQIPPETGKFLAILAASAPTGEFLEIGTSGGYSSLWLSLACRQRGAQLTTFELLDEKVKLARETFASAQVSEIVRIVPGDVRISLLDYVNENVAFCFLDTEKELYQECYDLVTPNLVSGGMLVADNVVSHAEELRPFIDHACTDPRVDAVVVPVGKGLLLCRKTQL